MIVSYSKNFIFIKTKKTAGTTVEAVLGAACADGDVVTLTSKKAGDVNRPDPRFYSHMTAAEAYPVIGPEFWQRAYKITVERHPYEKAVSQAYFKFALDDPEAMKVHIDEVVRTGDYPGFARWSLDGKVAVDTFIKQESLQADLERVGAHLGIAIPGELPQMKTRTRKDKRPAREILSEAQKSVVFERCEQEFALLGWDR
jgi:hypothetical protein